MASGVHAVAFSPASRLLATTGGDNVAILWDVASGQQSGPSLVGHVTRPNQLFPGVDAVAFSPDGNVLATGGLDHDIRLWDVNTHREIGEPLRSHAAGVTALTFDPNGTSLFSADEGGNIQIWNLAERTPMAAPFHGHSGSVTGLAFIPSMSAFASGGKDGRIVVWNPSRNPRSLLPRLGQYLQHTHDDAPVYNSVLRRRLFPSMLAKVVYSPSGNLLASVSDEGTVVIWDIQASKEIARFLAPLNQIFAVAFDHKDNVVAIGGLEDSVLLYQIHTGQTVKLPGHGRAAPALAFSPDDTMLATGTAAGTIKLWRTDNWAPIKSIGDFKTPVMFLTFLQNREIASVDLRGSVRKTSIESGVDVQTKTENRTDQRFPVVAAAGRLLAGGAGSTVALWDLDAWKPFGQGSIALHSSRIESLALDADGGRIAVGQNTDVTIYSTSSGQALLPALQVRTTLSGVALSPAGNALAVAAGEPYAYVWNLDPATWVQRACEIAMRPLSRDEWQQYLPSYQYEPACMQPPAPVR
jgi:WD40 repeat protein